ncbi:hypothetical protein PIB30_069492 [Stylosanthes scabra]|uniref:Uncharacterized protein n=1 Tax=Stylosanthes scabra TaxID=79078 RepID=A0ABU6RN65_9FABA|nr:hypothetical protein [Stylosanthes scabra]
MEHGEGSGHKNQAYNQSQPQPQPQILDRPILMMPTPGLPQATPPSFRPKQRIFRPPTSTLNVANPTQTNADALSA